GDDETVDARVETGIDRHIRERSVAVVVVQIAAAVRGRDGYVKEAVVVVIEDNQAAAAAGLVQPDPGRDVFEFHGWLGVAGLHLHALLDGDEFEVAARSLRRQPEPGAGSLVLGICREGLAAHPRGALVLTGA